MSCITLSLSSTEDAPNVTLPLVDRLSGGCPVVLATRRDIADHIAALAADDRNGTWSSLHVYVDTDTDGPRLRLHDCETAHCDAVPDHEYDTDVTIGHETESRGMFRVFLIDFVEVTA